MPSRLFRSLVVIALVSLLMLVLPDASRAAPANKDPKRMPLDIFALYLSDELQGPLFGPVKKVIIRNGDSLWTAIFAEDGKPLSREQFMPNFSHEVLAYDSGRPVKRVEFPGTDRQAVSFIRYSDAGRTFRVEIPNKDGTISELGTGTFTSQGLVATKSLKSADGSYIFDIAAEYSPTGLPVRETARFAKRGTITVERIFDKTGRILARVQIHSPQPDGPPSVASHSRIDYRYDLNGRLAEASFQSDKTGVVVLAIQGDYDKYGNWTKLVMTRRDQPGQSGQLFVQEIEYYR